MVRAWRMHLGKRLLILLMIEGHHFGDDVTIWRGYFLINQPGLINLGLRLLF